MHESELNKLYLFFLQSISLCIIILISCSKFQPDEADDLFNCARRVVRKLAIVHIAHAEYELSKGKIPSM